MFLVFFKLKKKNCILFACAASNYGHLALVLVPSKSDNSLYLKLCFDKKLLDFITNNEFGNSKCKSLLKKIKQSAFYIALQPA